MASRKEVNRYYPPDWDPSKGSLNAYHGESWRNGSATVNGRAGAARGVTIIRFETPWNMWCTNCNKMVGRGVRYNAEKNKAGKYYTTTLWEFKMKCHMCDGTIVIATDPKNDDYRIVSGAKRKEESWSTKSSETIDLMDDKHKKQLAADPMYRLEHVEGDKQKAIAKKASLSELIELRSSSDYDMNSKLRAKFRVKRKALKVQGKADADLLARSSLEMSAVTLVPEDPNDKALAAKMKFGDTNANSMASRKKQLNRTSIFSVPTYKVAQSSNSKVGKSKSGKSLIDPTKFRLLSNKQPMSVKSSKVGIVVKRKVNQAAVQNDNDGSNNNNSPVSPMTPISLVNYDDDSD